MYKAFFEGHFTKKPFFPLITRYLARIPAVKTESERFVWYSFSDISAPERLTTTFVPAKKTIESSISTEDTPDNVNVSWALDKFSDLPIACTARVMLVEVSNSLKKIWAIIIYFLFNYLITNVIQIYYIF